MGQIEDLRLFALVVENRSISKAAGKLRIAKSAVNRRLSLLEERYGSHLIETAALESGTSLKPLNARLDL